MNFSNVFIHWKRLYTLFFFSFCCSAFEVVHEVEDLNAEVVNAGNDDTLKLEEEEVRRRIELEAEERKLEETLEYQRRIENEAKLKHLAEQHKKTVRTNSEQIAETASYSYLTHQEDDHDFSGQQIYQKKVWSYSLICNLR